MNGKTRKQQIEEMLALEPNDPELHYMLAMEHVSGGNDAEAVRVFEALIKLAPDYPPGYHQGARALVRLNRISEASAILQRGIPAALKQGNHHAAGEMQELLDSLHGS
jgi:cytochrome c-type biogenesis protein CcmH/NrfG